MTAERDRLLRRQAETIAVKRTIERDQLRSAMPVGLAVQTLVAQIRRLRRTPCPTMAFDPAGGFESQLEALRDEIKELECETLGTTEHEAEVIDVVTCALHLAIAANINLEIGLAVQAAKLGARLDHIDAGGTWEEAKALEGAATRQGE